MNSVIKKKIAESLKKIPEIDFAFLFGSSKDGKAKKISDADVAVYLNTPETLDLIAKIVKAVETHTELDCDLSILNSASEILRFEALKGELFFARKSKLESYAEFYSITCREYEDKMFWMKRQLFYRGYS